MVEMNVCYLGDTDSIQKINIELLFRNKNQPIFFWNSWKATSEKETDLSVRNRLFWYKSQLIGVIDETYRKNIVSFFRDNRISVVVAYWGSNVFCDIATIKDLMPDVTVVLNVLCHPMAQSDLKITLQNFFFSISLRNIDGLIYSSYYMKHYFEMNVRSSKFLPSLILPPYWTKSFFTDSVSYNRLRPNVLFLGRMDWWDGDQSDNMEEIIKEMMSRGIHIYYGSRNLKKIDKVFSHPFLPKELDKLKSFGNKFDAALVAYNLNGCMNDTRFRVTVPDRLFASIAMGLPIAIPKKGYNACKEFLLEWPGIIEFESVEQLRNSLNDYKYIDGLKESCINKISYYYAENHFDYLMSFLKQLIRKNE